MNEKILVVDDEKEIADLIEVYLQNENMDVYKFYSGEEALSCIKSTDFDLAILDIMLPDFSGLSICQMIRSKEYTYPVIMLTAKDGETDKITGLTLGADDYITKPFLPLELIARIKAQLRRYKKYNVNSAAPAAEKVLRHAGLVMKLKTYECWLDEKSLALTPTEFTILKVLLEHKGSVVRSEELFHEIWQEEYYSKSNNTITVHIRHLREKMRDTGESPRYIKTVWGIGYKIGEI